MKRPALRHLLLALSLIATFSTRTRAADEAAVLIYNTFIAQGFDSNDHVSASISGALPSTCYYSPKAQVSWEGERALVEVHAYRRPTNDCVQMKIPFLLNVDLGVLDRGHYQVQAASGAIVLKAKSLDIAQSTSSAVDEYVYAPVEFVDDRDFDRKVELKGTLPSDCFALDRIEFVNNGSDTYAVLPIMKQVSQDCSYKEVPFVYEAEVPRTLNRDVVLLHVRTMNGNAINFLYRN